MISIIICTRNRSDSLARTLSSLELLTVGADASREIIVVDNNSSDDTKTVVDEFARQSNVETRYIFEAQRGLSHARNTGVRNARGAAIAFTDDDMILDPGWADSIADEMREHPEAVMYFGQTRIMRLDLPRIALREGESAEVYAYPCNPAEPGSGNNMIIRAAALMAVGEFDETLGAGSTLPGAEERDMIYRVLRSGGIVRYCPRILAYHDHNRISRRKYWSLLFDYGIGSGGFYCKHALKGDVWLIKTCLWEIRYFLKVMFQPNRMVPAFLHLMGIAVGFSRRAMLSMRRTTRLRLAPSRKQQIRNQSRLH